MVQVFYGQAGMTSVQVGSDVEVTGISISETVVTHMAWLSRKPRACSYLFPKNGLKERSANGLMVQEFYRIKVKMGVPNPLSTRLNHPKAYTGQLCTFIFLR